MSEEIDPVEIWEKWKEENCPKSQEEWGPSEAGILLGPGNQKLSNGVGRLRKCGTLLLFFPDESGLLQELLENRPIPEISHVAFPPLLLHESTEIERREKSLLIHLGKKSVPKAQLRTNSKN